MAAPTGTTLTAYSQADSYDNLDRVSSGSAGTYTYGSASQVHAVTGISSEVNPYAAYDAMGNMTCRNPDPTNAHTCAGSTPTGYLPMSTVADGQMASWTTPSCTVGNAHYLYAPRSLTAQEFRFVTENPSILAKTLFVFGATYFKREKA